MMDLFAVFIQEKTYLKGLSQKTLSHYQDSWKTFFRYKGEVSEAGIKLFVMNMAQSGMKPGAANAYSRSINSYLSWLYENKHLEIHLKAPLLKVEKRVLKTFKPEEAKKILGYHPTCNGEKRLLAILCTLVDTGIRIDESFNLTRDGVDLENLLLTVQGKGKKERKIPMSRELRKILYRWLKTHSHELVFCNRNGDKLVYDNIRRDFNQLLKKTKVQKTEGSFHAFRRYFAKQYVRNGGNHFYLMKQLGHTTLTMSKLYVEADEEDLKAIHAKSSPLEHLKN